MDKKDKRIYIRCTRQEKEIIEDKAARLNYPSTSRFMLDSALNSKQFVEDISGYQRVQAEVNKVGTNINQIAKYVNTYKSVTSDELIAVKKELKKIQLQLETLYNYRHFEKVEIKHGCH